MVRWFSMIVMCVCVSCSILDDSDITTVDDYKKLSLKTITIQQNLGNETRSKIASVTDSTLNISFTLGKLTKQIKIQWPAVEKDSKFKFRSAVTSNITIKNRYFADGKIGSCLVFSRDSIREQYYFKYNALGKLITLSTFIIEKSTSYSTNDTLIYNAKGDGWFAIRNSPQPARRALFGGELLSNQSCQLMQVFKVSANIPGAIDRQYNYCDKNNFYIYPGGESADLYTIGDNLLEEVYIGNRRKDSDTNCCGDLYYFHPFLLLSVDMRLRVMYAPDWWEVKNGTTSNEKDQSVKLEFKYE